jgi:plasmid maintenance system antidote protein VapI
MLYPNLRMTMDLRRVRLYNLAQHLKMSDAALSARLHGRYQLEPHLRNRIAEYFALNPDWLFTVASIPRSARIETTMLIPGAETR